MDYVRLGRTGLEVSRICLGCMSYGVPERVPNGYLAQFRYPFVRRSMMAEDGSAPAD